MYLHIKWDPPIGIPLGDLFTIRFYSIFFIIAFLLGLSLMKRVFRKERVSTDYLDPLFIYVIIGTFLGARLGHVFFYDWGYFKDHLLEILLPIRETPGGVLFGYSFIGFQGLASHGATIGIFIALYFYSKRTIKKPISWILDRVVMPIAIGGALVRLGNFWNSEIVGKQTDVPWAIEFVNMSSSYGEITARHPTQLYEAFGYVVLFFILRFFYFKKGKGNQPWFLFGVFFVALWTIRLLVEFVKEPQEQGREDWIWIFNTGQALSIPFILVGFFVLYQSYQLIKK